MGSVTRSLGAPTFAEEITLEEEVLIIWNMKNAPLTAARVVSPRLLYGSQSLRVYKAP